MGSPWVRGTTAGPSAPSLRPQGPRNRDPENQTRWPCFAAGRGSVFGRLFGKKSTGGASHPQPRPRTCAKSGRIREPVRARSHIKDSCSTGRIPAQKQRIPPKHAKMESLFALCGTNPASPHERALIWAHGIPVDGTKCPGHAQTPQIWISRKTCGSRPIPAGPLQK